MKFGTGAILVAVGLLVVWIIGSGRAANAQAAFKTLLTGSATTPATTQPTAGSAGVSGPTLPVLSQALDPALTGLDTPVLV